MAVSIAQFTPFFMQNEWKAAHLRSNRLPTSAKRRSRSDDIDDDSAALIDGQTNGPVAAPPPARSTENGRPRKQVRITAVPPNRKRRSPAREPAEQGSTDSKTRDAESKCEVAKRVRLPRPGDPSPQPSSSEPSSKRSHTRVSELPEATRLLRQLHEERRQRSASQTKLPPAKPFLVGLPFYHRPMAALASPSPFPSLPPTLPTDPSTPTHAHQPQAPSGHQFPREPLSDSSRASHFFPPAPTVVHHGSWASNLDDRPLTDFAFSFGLSPLPSASSDSQGPSDVSMGVRNPLASASPPHPFRSLAGPPSAPAPVLASTDTEMTSPRRDSSSVTAPPLFPLPFPSANAAPFFSTAPPAMPTSFPSPPTLHFQVPSAAPPLSGPSAQRPSAGPSRKRHLS